MGHSFVSSYFHYVFSTKAHEPYINAELRDRLWRYMGGIARENKMKPIEIGGVEDHVHMLLGLPAPMAIAKAVQLVKGGSSKWVHDTFPRLRYFEWQEGYGAFGIGKSQVPETIEYIRNQEQHHKKRTFQEEFLAFLKAHDMEHDERYIWD